jgi:DNA-binding NarL/FixJ family response regulator
MSPNEGPITLVLATDSFLIGDGLACMLAGVSDVDVVGRARDHHELVQMVEELDPQAVLISIRTPVVTTLATLTAARRLRDDHPDLGIVVISDRGNGFALELLSEGATHMAYLLDERLSGMDAVLGALREVLSGQSVLDPSIVDALVHRRDVTTIDDLTPREIDVLELMARGLSNRGIAGELNLSVKGIEKHVTTIFRKLDLTDQSFIDRRVTAALTFLRSQDHPFLVTPDETEESGNAQGVRVEPDATVDHRSDGSAGQNSH